MAQSISDQFSFHQISVGEILNKEVAKKTDNGKLIDEARKQNRYVNDNVIIDLVKK